MAQFRVSVIIPVFNAASFVRQAVESALIQPETEEVILVEDGSPDNSWEICQQIAAGHSKVRLYRHPDGGNHGAGATRNLAIRKSICEYIAFLDADDFFLPNRFSVAKDLFEADNELEGVYEAITMNVEDEAGIQRWNAANRSSAPLSTMYESLPPENLYAALIEGRYGDIHLDGLVVKRDIIEKTGYMDEDLSLHQDSAFIFKAAAVSKLMPGRLNEPVAMWRVHDQNRISAPRPQKDIYLLRLKFWYILWEWSRTHLVKKQQQLLLKALLNDGRFKSRFKRPLPRWLYGVQQRFQLFLLPFSYPAILNERAFWRAFLIHPDKWFHRLQR